MNGSNMRFINTLILVLFCVLGITGLYGLVWPFPSLLFEIHRIAGWALIVLIPWKTIIALRSLRRGLTARLDRSVLIVISILLSVATLTILVLVIRWTWQIGPYYVWIAGYGYSAIGWHWGIALGLAPLFIIHVWRRWHRPKAVDFAGRRQALKLMGLGAATLFSWGAAEILAKAAEGSGTQRRFTGSREDGSFTGLDYPVTSGPDQGRIKLHPATWRFTVTGHVNTPLTFHYNDVLALSMSETTATVDCTGGWYATQIWRGIWLQDLLAQAGVQPEKFMIVLKGVADYTAQITPAEISDVLLATHVGGQTLDHWHGYPLRAVVPSRRGWHWVKWLTEVEIRTI